MLPFELTKDTPYLALSGELWSVFYEYFTEIDRVIKGFYCSIEPFFMQSHAQTQDTLVHTRIPTEYKPNYDTEVSQINTMKLAIRMTEDGPGAHFTKRLWVHNSNIVKILFALVWIEMMSSGHNLHMWRTAVVLWAKLWPDCVTDSRIKIRAI